MAKEFEIGRMRTRLVWQTNDSGTVDEMNESTEGWATQGTYWAEVIPIAGVEQANGGQAKSVSSYAVKMRHVGAIKPSDRFLFEYDNTRILDIRDVNREGERNAYLRIDATELKRPQ